MAISEKLVALFLIALVVLLFLRMILLKAVTDHPPVEPKPKARLAVGCLAPPADAPDLSIERDVIGIACDATRIDFSCRLMLRRHPLGMMLRGLACGG